MIPYVLYTSHNCFDQIKRYDLRQCCIVGKKGRGKSITFRIINNNMMENQFYSDCQYEQFQPHIFSASYETKGISEQNMTLCQIPYIGYENNVWESPVFPGR